MSKKDGGALSNLTVRDVFACFAVVTGVGANIAYKVADSMLKAREDGTHTDRQPPAA